MKTIDVNLVVATGGQTLYIPVPCRGVVVAVKHVSNINSVATGTIIASRSTTAVNTLTVITGDIAAGIVEEGTPDVTNKGLIFDPDSATATDKVIKVVFDSTIHAGAGIDTLEIEFDDSAYVKQTALEA